jgi:hypothetical protein
LAASGTDQDKDVISAQERVADAVDGVTDAQEKVEDAHDKVEDANDRVTDASRRLVDAQDSVKDAVERVAEAQDGVTEAHKRVADAEDGVSNASYRQVTAAEALTDAQDRLKEAYTGGGGGGGGGGAIQSQLDMAEALHAAKEAHVELAEKMAEQKVKALEAEGATIRQWQAQGILRDSLKEVAATLAPGSPLRKALDEYIAQLEKEIVIKMRVEVEKSGEQVITNVKKEIGTVHSRGGWAGEGPLLRGPTGTDTIRTYLTPGEFVVPKHIAQRNKDVLAALMSGTVLSSRVAARAQATIAAATTAASQATNATGQTIHNYWPNAQVNVHDEQDIRNLDWFTRTTLAGVAP